MIDLRPLGDHGFLSHFADESQARRWAEAVRLRAIPGVVDVAVAYASAAIFLDPDAIDPDRLGRVLEKIEPIAPVDFEGRTIRLPVLYDGEDLSEVARLVGLGESEVIRHHTSGDFTVFALGFLPGFAYSGYLTEPLAGLARRKDPRVRVPAGSVAIAGRQTGVYPAESPGGWHLLGRTPLKIVDLSLGLFPIRPGDRLRFESIDSETYRDRLGEPLAAIALAE
ncbi:5-oxoprolinase subunit B family protein [Tundrisphaera lichenicola]|uniref:5-oxoprolinase subunit B family protein n=1 Tax=Tundrisphaera lichenicola TaxID=2029860 RepID=UPI003EBDAE97